MQKVSDPRVSNDSKDYICHLVKTSKIKHIPTETGCLTYFRPQKNLKKTNAKSRKI